VPATWTGSDEQMVTFVDKMMVYSFMASAAMGTLKGIPGGRGQILYTAVRLGILGVANELASRPIFRRVLETAPQTELDAMAQETVAIVTGRSDPDMIHPIFRWMYQGANWLGENVPVVLQSDLPDLVLSVLPILPAVPGAAPQVAAVAYRHGISRREVSEVLEEARRFLNK
jgi:hypothetical protein